MNNAIDLLNQIQKLMELRGENPFKIRAFEKAAQNLAGQCNLEERARLGTLTQIPGIGKGISEVLTEFLLTGRSQVREELEKALPPGLRELATVAGLGPKKALLLIENLGIQSVGELEYACKENRLLKLKGFGPKIQQKILNGLHFQNANRGFQKLSDVYETAQKCEKALQKVWPNGRVTQTGALRRKLETLQKLEYLVESSDGIPAQAEGDVAISKVMAETESTLPIELYFSSHEKYGWNLAKLTGTLDHWEALGSPEEFDSSTEEDFFKKLELPFIPAEVRETGEEVALARAGFLSGLLPWDGIRGIFHNHTTRSDGNATLEEMVIAAEARGYEYIGISDHSQTAFYAQGLKECDLLEQENEIKEVQEKHPGIRIFWGIESDILADGSLDYDEQILKRFDFVIASVHSRFQMDRETMTARILAAVRNPYTRFLGHPTGRLLLGRKGYDVDLEAVIAEAAKRDVAIEINANPARLDLDWRWGPIMRKCQTLTSVNPDAHETQGLEDVFFGIAMARKALLSTHQVINSKSTQEVEKWLKRI